QLAVEPARLAQVQVTVQVGDPGADRESARAAVALQRAAHLARVGIDEDGQLGAFRQAGHVHQDVCALVRPARGAHRGDLPVRTRGLRGGDLPGERQPLLAYGNGQLVAVHDLLDLEGS